MAPTRRDFLKLLALGVAGYEMDLDKLLWIPGEKKHFIISKPGQYLNFSEIVAIEMERMIPAMRALFERDDVFYRELDKFQNDILSDRELKVPLWTDKKYGS